MEKSLPIEIPLEQVKQVLGNEDLTDVLQELKKQGAITHFIVRAKTLLIWTKNKRRAEVALMAEEASRIDPAPTKRKLH